MNRSKVVALIMFALVIAAFGTYHSASAAPAMQSATPYTDTWGNQIYDEYGHACYIINGTLYGVDNVGNLWYPGYCGYTYGNAGGSSGTWGGNTGGGSSSYCPPGFDAYTCQLLGAASREAGAAQSLIDDLAAQGITATSGGLIERCMNGDIQACYQYSAQADIAIQQYDSMYGPGSGWAESFSYGD